MEVAIRTYAAILRSSLLKQMFATTHLAADIYEVSRAFSAAIFLLVVSREKRASDDSEMNAPSTPERPRPTEYIHSNMLYVYDLH